MSIFDRPVDLSQSLFSSPFHPILPTFLSSTSETKENNELNSIANKHFQPFVSIPAFYQPADTPTSTISSKITATSSPNKSLKNRISSPASLPQDKPIDKIEGANCLNQLNNLEKIFDKSLSTHDNRLNDYKDLWIHLTNFHHFREELLSCLSEFLSLKKCEYARERLDRIYDPFKALKPLGNSVIGLMTCFAIQQAQTELTSIQNALQKQDKLNKDKTIQKRIDRLSNRIKEALEEAINESTGQAAKVFGNHYIAAKLSVCAGLSEKSVLKGSKLAFDIKKEFKDIYKIWQSHKQQKEWEHYLKPHIKIDFCSTQEIQKKNKQETEAFIQSLNNCKTIEEIKEALKAAKISLAIPNDIDEWKNWLQQEKMQDHLSQAYQYHKGITSFVKQDDLQALLDKKQQNFLQRLALSQEKVEQLITECQNLNFNEINEKLAKEHLFLNRLDSAPKNKEEWDQAIQEEKFIHLLSKQRAEYSETIGQLVEQGIRVGLLKKIEIERKLLISRGIESIISVALIMLRLSSYFPGLLAEKAKDQLDLFLKKIKKVSVPLLGEIPVLGVGLLTIFCFGYEFRPDNLLMIGIHHSIGYYYKPNEYSLQGYKLGAQIKFAQLYAQLYFCLNYLKRLLLWIRIRVVESLILRIKNRSVETNSHYQDLKYRLNQYTLDYTAQIMKLEKKLEKLQLEDVKSCWHYPSASGQQTKEKEEFNPLETLIDSLSSVDFDCFNQENLNFFQENLGLVLTEDNKPNIASKIEKFFIKTELAFTKAYLINRASFLASNLQGRITL